MNRRKTGRFVPGLIERQFDLPGKDAGDAGREGGGQRGALSDFGPGRIERSICTRVNFETGRFVPGTIERPLDLPEKGAGNAERGGGGH